MNGYSQRSATLPKQRYTSYSYESEYERSSEPRQKVIHVGITMPAFYVNICTRDSELNSLSLTNILATDGIYIYIYVYLLHSGRRQMAETFTSFATVRRLF